MRSSKQVKFKRTGRPFKPHNIFILVFGHILNAQIFPIEIKDQADQLIRFISDLFRGKDCSKAHKNQIKKSKAFRGLWGSKLPKKRIDQTFPKSNLYKRIIDFQASPQMHIFSYLNNYKKGIQFIHKNMNKDQFFI